MRIRAFCPLTDRREMTGANRAENKAVLVRRVEPSEARQFLPRERCLFT